MGWHICTMLSSRTLAHAVFLFHDLLDMASLLKFASWSNMAARAPNIMSTGQLVEEGGRAKVLASLFALLLRCSFISLIRSILVATVSNEVGKWTVLLPRIKSESFSN